MPLPTPIGYFSHKVTTTTPRDIEICPAGYYCIAGVKRPCPAGTFADGLGAHTPLCGGLWYLIPYPPTHTHFLACSHVKMKSFSLTNSYFMNSISLRLCPPLLLSFLLLTHSYVHIIFVIFVSSVFVPCLFVSVCTVRVDITVLSPQHHALCIPVLREGLARKEPPMPHALDPAIKVPHPLPVHVTPLLCIYQPHYVYLYLYQPPPVYQLFHILKVSKHCIYTSY